RQAVQSHPRVDDQSLLPLPGDGGLHRGADPGRRQNPARTADAREDRQAARVLRRANRGNALLAGPKRMTRSVYITRTAAFLPNAPVGNDDMERVLGQAGDKPSRARRMVLRSNGITSRHYAIDPVTLKPTHTNAQLTAEVVRKLGVDLSTVSCLACGTSLPDQ